MEKSTSSFHACYIAHGKKTHLSMGNTLLFWKIPLVVVDAGAECAVDVGTLEEDRVVEGKKRW